MKQLIKLLKSRNKFTLKSEGNSMQPFLYSGDILYYKKIEFKSIKVNDLIIIYNNKNVFTHRVIYSEEKRSGLKRAKGLTSIITKGDNNASSDGRIYPYQLIGKVYQVKRNGKMFNHEDYYLIQSTQYFQEIVKIKKELEEENIDLVFLKGLPLHLYFEKSHPRRIYADCDILVNYKELEIIDNILINQGYKRYDPSYSKLHKFLKNKPTEIQYTKIINGFSVIFDVHFEVNFLMNQLGKMNELYPQDLIDKLTKDCIDSRRIITINNYQFSILSNEFLILYLALHFFHHNFRGAFRLEFLDKVIRKTLQIPSPLGNPSATPGVFLSLSNNITKYKLQNFVYPVFLLLKKYYSSPLPVKFLDSIKPDEGKMKYIKSNILNINIFDDETRIQAGVTRFKNLFYLSPNPLWRKIMIIFNLQVIYSVFWVMIFFFRRLVKRYFR